MKSAALAFITALPLLAAGPEDCARLQSLTLPDTTIRAAEFLPAGPFTVPAAGRNPAQTVQAPARCRLNAILRPSPDSEIEIEIWLPASWNGRFLGVGNGGWSGAVVPSALAAGVREGYATISTDTGHKGPRGEFVLGHPEKAIDFGYRAVHEMTVKGKAIVNAYYGAAPRYSYWQGCSSGGKQGLKEAQMYPADYDGIIAGAPANHWTHLSASLLSFGYANLKDPAATIPTAKLPHLNKAVLAACDAADGVKDGILRDPRTCKFDPAALLCKSGDHDDCLTAPQIETVRAVYGPVKNPKSGEIIFPGLTRGSEFAWQAALGGPEPFMIPYDHFRFFVHADPNWNWRQFDLARDTATSDEKDKYFAATNPDLSAFQKRGGKLLLWHGWSDQLIAPENSINYYQSVLAQMGPNQSNWLRLFMAPGMLHCSGGPGPDQFNSLAVMERWVEKGEPPQRIEAFHATDNKVDMTRPLCPYPQVAVYKGSGSANDSANFTCQAP